MKKNIKKIIIPLLVVVVGVLASLTLFKHNFYFNMHDDLQMMRQLQLEKCFADGQIPCRWVPDMGYGHGFPLFNYYPQLPYLFGQVFRLFGFVFNDVAKLTFALGIIASGVGMYLMSKEFFGKLGGILSAILYIWAPYHSLDIYVRGAMNESWAFVWFPIILWGIYKLVKEGKNKYFIILSLAISALLLTHNIMVMIFVPVAALWTIGWLVAEKNWKIIIKLGLSGILSLGLSAFFTLPAIFEQKYVHIDTLVTGYFQYHAHFATIYQLFISRFWGDGPSAFGVNDGLAFPVGHVHWILAIIVTILLVVKIIKTKKIINFDLIALFAILVGTMGAFMSHQRSFFIWENLPVLEFVQFPWRFLTLNVLGYSIAGGALVYLVKEIGWLKKSIWQYLLVAAISLLVIIINWNFFKPIHSGPMSDEEKFSGEAWRIQTQAGILDYLPIQAKDDPPSARNSLVDVVDGKVEVSNESYGTDWAKFDLEIQSTEAKIRVNIFNYPIWKAYVDGVETKIYVDDNEEWGRIYIDVSSGNREVYLKLNNTSLRNVANGISVVAWLVLISYFFWGKKIMNGRLT
jgi:hypothetical protein